MGSLSLLLAAALALPVFAQDPPPCPTVNTSCPDSSEVGSPVTYTANVSGGDPDVTPTYNWTISAGTIESGQGTSTITVSTAELVGNVTITATVDVGGYDRSCSTSSSCTTIVTAKSEARKVDQYGAIKAKDENPRLDNLAIELGNDPTAQAYVMVYGGRKSKASDARKTAARARGYLAKTRGVDPNRVVLVEGGYRDTPEVELWIVPPGAAIPDATPTVDPSELKASKPAKKSKSSKSSKSSKRKKA